MQTSRTGVRTSESIIEKNKAIIINVLSISDYSLNHKIIIQFFKDDLTIIFSHFQEYYLGWLFHTDCLFFQIFA